MFETFGNRLVKTSTSPQIARWARWLFALIAFTYLWREGGVWRYVAVGGFFLLVFAVITVAILQKHPPDR